MTLRLRCLRCGDEYDTAEVFCEDRCDDCEYKLSQVLVWRGERAHLRAVLRYRSQVGHPTEMALDALESTPHGTLVEEPQ